MNALILKKTSTDTFIFLDTSRSKCKMHMLKTLYSESVAKTGIETLPCSYSYIGHGGVKCKLIGEGGKRDMGGNTMLYEKLCVQ